HGKRVKVNREARASSNIFFYDTYYHVPRPGMFCPPNLERALNCGEQKSLMSTASWWYAPDDPEFVQLSCTIFDRTVDDGRFDSLYSTNHFGTLAFYLALNGNIAPMLN
ncbi:hypothetical protein PENTCL1PPCAC_7268, partial [Pristionchus entomophagus]